MVTVAFGVVVHSACVMLGREATTALGIVTVVSEEIVGSKLLG
jgi:hypothetical protein